MAGTLAAAPFGSLALAGDAEAGNEQSPGPQSAMTPEPAQPSSEATLVPAAFADLPHWLQDDHLAALRTFLRSCTELAKAEDAAPQDARVAALASACRAADDLKRPGRAAARTFFEQHFVPYRVAQKEGTGFLTGYYEPVLNGSRTPQGRFQTPLYRRPPDLVNLMAETERAAASAGGKLTHMRKTEAGLEPFPTRAEIERGALKGHGLELIYLEDPVDAFFMQVQGSGRIKLRDGGTVRLNYDGKNGYPYTSIGRYIVDKGFFTAEEITLQRLRAFLRADPQRAREVMWQNQSFVFFRELDPAVAAEGPLGAQSVPLTPGRSLAVDTVFHALGTPVYVTSPSLKLGGGEDGFHRLMIAQDVGSAIKGPQRGDIYYGSGDKAGRLAGTTKHEGSFFVLLPASLDSSAWQGKAATRKR
jgi:membrane-bound lytic murein transglycosylase A